MHMETPVIKSIQMVKSIQMLRKIPSYSGFIRGQTVSGTCFSIVVKLKGLFPL